LADTDKKAACFSYQPTLFHLMKSGDHQTGIATVCIVIGQGIATIFERV
jgi:acetyl-CoA acetyltransferase